MSISSNYHEDLNNFLGELVEDKEYSLRKHSLGEGEKVGEHSHEEVEEFAVFPNGHFAIKTEDGEREVEVDSGFQVFYFPPETVHGLENLENDIDYLVLRDQEEKEVYRAKEVYVANRTDDYGRSDRERVLGFFHREENGRDVIEKRVRGKVEGKGDISFEDLEEFLKFREGETNSLRLKSEEGWGRKYIYSLSEVETKDG